MEISNFKISYRPGETKRTKGSDKLTPYLSELPLISEIQKDENNPIYLMRNNPLLVKETIRRMNGFYNSVTHARFFLSISQLKLYPDFLQPDSDSASHIWISNTFLSTAIVSYQSAFDLLLQISWIYSEIYTKYKYKDEDGRDIEAKITSSTIPFILKKCSWDRIEKNSDMLDLRYFEKIQNFYNCDIYNQVNNLANSIKHRQTINFDNEGYLTGIVVLTDEYNSEETNLKLGQKEIITLLKNYHLDLHKVVKELVATIIL